MEDNKDSVLVLVRDSLYEVRNDEWDKAQIETIVSATAEFSSNFSDFYPISGNNAEMFLDILTNIFELKVVPQFKDVYLEVF